MSFRSGKDAPARGPVAWLRRPGRVVAALLGVGVLAALLLLARTPVQRWLAARDLERAQELIVGQRVDDAASALAAALRRNPRLAGARQALGELELQRGRLEEAFLQFLTLSELQPEAPAGWDGLARVRSGQVGVTNGDTDRYLRLATP